MDPRHHRRLLLTSHVLCDAWAFGRRLNNYNELDKPSAFPVCTAAIKRVMLPNICVQGSQLPLQGQLSSREISLFLHDGVRPFTMSFVFKLNFTCVWSLQPAALVSIMQRISATMPYLETLRIDDIPEKLGDRASAFVAALPSSLRVLHLPSPYRFSNTINVHQVTRIIFPPSLKFIEPSFCADSYITEIDLSVCAHSLEFVDTDNFFYHCRSLQKFDTTPLLGAIGSHVCESFLQYCSSLTEVDLAGLRGVTSIGDLFLASCGSLHKVRGCDALSSVESIGDGFLFESGELEEFDFLQLAAVRKCGRDGFLADSALEEEGRKILEEIMERNNEDEEEEWRDYENGEFDEEQYENDDDTVGSRRQRSK